MLIDCPECHNSISDKAKSCPHCGFQIQSREDVDKNIPKPVYVVNDTKSNSSLNCGEKIGCWALMILFFFISALLINCHGEQQEKEYINNLKAEQKAAELRGYHDYSNLYKD